MNDDGWADVSPCTARRPAHSVRVNPEVRVKNARNWRLRPTGPLRCLEGVLRQLLELPSCSVQGIGAGDGQGPHFRIQLCLLGLQLLQLRQ